MTGRLPVLHFTMLPEKRSSPFLPASNAGAVDDARRIEVRPRGSSTRPDGAVDASESLLHFSCPACLHMMAAPRATGIVQCPACTASVMPPQVVNMGLAATGKTALPPPKKTGAHPLKH